ncbi:MAG: flagellin [Thermoguttaceae bacterium]
MTGLYLNTNVSSLQSQNYLRRNMSDLSNVLTRLSTGLRINSGKDDPAGLIASELIRSDITGAKMAIRNTQRANSVISIADSALGQVSSMLNDIRGLINEAANDGAMSADQIAANQLQIDASLDSIDRIARTTNYMGKKILDGSLDFVTAGSDPTQMDYLRIDSANFGTAPKIGVNIDIVKDADNARLFFNRAGVSQKTVLEIGGNKGSEVINLGANATVVDIARSVNLVSDATGVRAIVGQEATKGQLLATSAGGGVNNDINITALDAGFMQGNYSVKFSAGTGSKTNYAITTPAPNKAGVIDIQLEMEEAKGASAHALNYYFDIQARQSGTMFNDTDVIFVEDNAASTTINGVTYNAAASFEKGPRAATGTLVERNAAGAVLAGGNTLKLSAASTGTAFNNVDIQYVKDSSLATSAGASYDADAKILTIAVRDDNTTYADVAAALKANTDFRLNDVTTTAGGVSVTFDTKIAGAADQLARDAIGATGATMGTASNALVVRYQNNGNTALADITAVINSYTNTATGQTGSLFEAKVINGVDSSIKINTTAAQVTLGLGAIPGTDTTFSFNYNQIKTSSGKPTNGLFDGMKIALVDGAAAVPPSIGNRYDLGSNTVVIDITAAGAPTNGNTLATHIANTINGQRIAGQPAGETIVVPAGSVTASANTAIVVADDTGKSAYVNAGIASKFQGNTTFGKILQGGSCGYVSKLTANQVIDYINGNEELSRLIRAENAFKSNGSGKVTLFDEAAYYGSQNADNALQFLGPKGSTNVVFTGSVPNQQLSLGFIPAATALPEATLVSTNANAAFTLLGAQKGAAYDDVAVRFIASANGTSSVTYNDCPSSAMAYVSLNPTGALNTNSGFIVNAKTPGEDYNNTSIVFRYDASQSAPAKAAYDKDNKRLVVTVNSNSGNPSSNPPSVTTQQIIDAINTTPEFSAELDHSGGVNNGNGASNLLFPETNPVATFSNGAKLAIKSTITDGSGNPAAALFKDMTVTTVAATAAAATVAYDPATHTLTIKPQSGAGGDAATIAAIEAYFDGTVPVRGQNITMATGDVTLTGGSFPATAESTGFVTGATTAEVTIGNTGQTGGNKGGTVEIRLASGADGNSVLTSKDVIDMINADSVVSKYFSARSYVGSDSTGTFNFHSDTIRNFVDGNGKTYPATVMKTSGGVAGEDLMEIKLATDKNGYVTTTARDLVNFMNELDADTTRGISVSLVYPQGVDNLLRTWSTDICGNVTEEQACADPYGYGLLKPTIITDNCNNVFFEPIEFNSFGEKTSPTRPWGEVVAVNGIDASFRVYASQAGTDYEGVSIQYIATTGGAGGAPRAEYDAKEKKLNVYFLEGSTATTIANLIQNSEQTKNLFTVQQLGTGSGIVTVDDDSVSLKNGTYNAGYRGGAVMLGAADADPHKLVFESTAQGTEQRVDVRVMNGAPFDTYDAAGNKVQRDYGEDMVARINGLTMVAHGRNLSVSNSMLAMSLTVSDKVTTGDTISFDIVSGGATFQIGPDVVSSQQLRLGFQSMSTARLGGPSGRLMQLRDGEVGSLINNTKLADLIVQEAINSVAVLRGRLGTIQRSTLDPNMSVLQDTLVEMEAADAIISNADFAEESSRLTRTQIMVQSGAKTLSLANQLPQYAAMLLG